MASETETKNAEWVALLTHALGAGEEVPRSRRGYRNRFCAEVSDPPRGDYAEWIAMEAAGLAERYGTINQGRDRYFGATKAGMQYIGLSNSAMKRALAD